MGIRSTTRFLAVLAAVGAGSACGPPAPTGRGAAQQDSLLAADAERGRMVYRRACASCHGERGDGRGEAARGLDPPPRDLRRAVYRYRSTPTGSLPRREDLVRTVLFGVPDTAMPAWRDLLTSQQVLDVVAAVEQLSPRFASEEIDEPIRIPMPLPYGPPSVARGRQVYESMQCGKCHGDAGEGDGWAKADEMRDDGGHVMRARDFTRGIYRSGNLKEDIYRTFYTGLDGTPMPGYEDSLSPHDIYHLVNYLLSLERERDLWYWLGTPPRWYEPSEQGVRP